MRTRKRKNKNKLNLIERCEELEKKCRWKNNEKRTRTLTRKKCDVANMEKSKQRSEPSEWKE